jgi:hypothetical protein
MAVRFGAALGAVVLTGAGCGGTLEGKYRRGEIGPGGSTTTRPRATTPAGAAGSDAGVRGAPADVSVRVAPAEEPAP